MIKAVLFDMDGVLVDTEWFYNRRRVAFMEEKGFHFDEIPDLSGSNEPAIWKALVPDDVELRERLRVEYKQVYSPVHPVPYAELLNEQTEPVMRELHDRGVNCAIASSSYRELIDELVEIAGIGPAPFAAMMLSDLGAEVIRVDRAQAVRGLFEGSKNLDLTNRGRRSVALDLKHPDGVATLLDLVSKADVLIEGFRPGVAERLGIGPDECRAVNPRLV